jgi:CxC2 like cysteine cluster associated with KDZ transposases
MGSFFARHSLADAGLVVQLGHDGHDCQNPIVHKRPLTVIDISGIHMVNYTLCGWLGSPNCSASAFVRASAPA